MRGVGEKLRRRLYRQASGLPPPQHRRAGAIQRFQRVRGEQTGWRAQLPAAVAVHKQQAVALAAAQLGSCSVSTTVLPASLRCAPKPAAVPDAPGRGGSAVRPAGQICGLCTASCASRARWRSPPTAVSSGRWASPLSSQVARCAARSVGASPKGWRPSARKSRTLPKKPPSSPCGNRPMCWRAGERWQRVESLVVEHDVAVRGVGLARQHGQQGRFSGAIGA